MDMIAGDPGGEQLFDTSLGPTPIELGEVTVGGLHTSGSLLRTTRPEYPAGRVDTLTPSQPRHLPSQGKGQAERGVCVRLLSSAAPLLSRSACVQKLGRVRISGLQRNSRFQPS
jgi:hypothetical protein